MIVGDPALIAIESAISQPFKALGQRALGFFVLHVGGRCFGVRAPDATLLACSFDEVRERLTRRGRHRASIGADTEALAVASAFRSAQYCDETAERLHFGQTAEQFCTSLFESHIVWAPDGDAAFDDGSHVLHFDYGDRVRLIAFRNELDQLQFEASVVETLIDAASFYAVLEEWQATFEAEWRAALINH